MDRRLPSVADRDGEYYLRQEGKGLLVGAYEKDMRFWAEDGTPPGFGHELFADDLDRIEPTTCCAPCARMPAVGQRRDQARDQRPDDLVAGFLRALRPGAGADRLFLLQRHHPGLFSQSGGLGKLPPNGWSRASPSWTCSAGTWRATAMPGRPRPSPRRARSTATPTASRSTSRTRSARPAARSACARSTSDAEGDGRGLRAQRRLGAQSLVSPARACRRSTSTASSASPGSSPSPRSAPRCARRRRARRLELRQVHRRGPGGAGSAGGWLDRVVANKVPTPGGRSCLTPLIGLRGGIAGDFTITKTGDDQFLVVGSAHGRALSPRAFFNMVEKPLPAGPCFESSDRGDVTGFNVAGPRAREHPGRA
jgi:dimethylglycine dehydrogenase